MQQDQQEKFCAVQESLCSLRFAAKVNATDIGTARRMALPASSRG